MSAAEERHLGYGTVPRFLVMPAGFDSTKKKPFGEQSTYADVVLAIVVIDDSHRPFAHLFPMMLPGSNIPPAVSSLHFHCINWSSTRPHNRFFDCLAFFTGIKKLELVACCLSSAWDLRRTVSALSNLEILILNSIQLLDRLLLNFGSHPLLKGVRNLQRIQLVASECPGTRTLDRWNTPNSTHRMMSHNILAVCASFPTRITALELDVDFFCSIAELARFISRFPELRNLATFGDPTSPEWRNPTSRLDGAVLGRETTGYIRPLSTLTMRSVPTTCARELLALVFTTETCGRLTELEVDHSDSTGPTAEVVEGISQVLKACGPALHAFRWSWPCDRGLLL